jgi:phenylpropionate dioxygenase-like ring-hydroxylating dioxygenase large terminal subunit
METLGFDTAGVGSPELARALDEGWTLPARWYSDPEIARLERERIFTRTWQYAGRTEQVEEPASFFTSTAGHIPVVVVRDREGELRGFVNVCRHRGHVVAQGEGCRETLQCPYHAWTYGLDGSLRKAPRSEREPGFDPNAFSLLPIAVDTWGPFVFVNPDAEAAPLADTLGELPGFVARSGLDLDALTFHSHYEWEIAVNWKVGIENYLECYHCPVAHPSFSKVIDVDPDSYELRTSPTFSSQFGPVRASALEGNGSAPYDARGEVTQAQYHFVWPNTTINIDPGPQNMSIERWIPVGTDKVIEVTDSFFGPDVTEERAQELLAFGTQVAQEDVALCESVQAGLNSGMVPQGRLMLSSEKLISHFQHLFYGALAD